MRKKLWSFDTVTVDLEDNDVTVAAVHFVTGATITVNMRLKKCQISGPTDEFRKKLEHLATNEILDLASFLEIPWEESE